METASLNNLPFRVIQQLSISNRDLACNPLVSTRRLCVVGAERAGAGRHFKRKKKAPTIVRRGKRDRECIVVITGEILKGQKPILATSHSIHGRSRNDMSDTTHQSGNGDLFGTG